MEKDYGECQICEARTTQLRHILVTSHSIRRSERLCCTALACGLCMEKIELIRKLMIGSTCIAMLPLLVLGTMAFFAESSITDWLRYGGTTLTLASLSCLGLLWIARWRLLSGTVAGGFALGKHSNPGMH